MSKRRGQSANTMLELWRPPQRAGEPIGCLASTFTFDANLFDEQCLGRFLDIDADPEREDLSFLLQREDALGHIYAGILVDHTQADVEHSLRWDVLPVEVRGARQHAKLSLLLWKRHLRIIVSSANLTNAGYRQNREVAATIDATPHDAQREHVETACDFLEVMLGFVPGAAPDVPHIRRAVGFLQQVRDRVAAWRESEQAERLQRRLVLTHPALPTNPATGGRGPQARSALAEAVTACDEAAGPANEAWVASPFFDIEQNEGDDNVAALTLVEALDGSAEREVWLAAPMLGSDDENAQQLRLAAPRALLRTLQSCVEHCGVQVLPMMDDENNVRPWHAKMLRLASEGYTATLIGSSNFTRAGLGIDPRYNFEANLLLIAMRRRGARDANRLDELWPDMAVVDDPASAEWIGPDPEIVEEEWKDGRAATLPAGFLPALFHGGKADGEQRICLRFAPDRLPETWTLHAVIDNRATALLDSAAYAAQGHPIMLDLPWAHEHPPEKLLVRWDEHEVGLPMNVTDATQLPPPPVLEKMTAEQMLRILAASDPAAAFRAWVRRQPRDQDAFDDDLDAAGPADLDPLKRYDLRDTFLRRIRDRARVLARVRQQLQRPALSERELHWRFEGILGARAVVDRLWHEFVQSDGEADEALLSLADLLITLCELEYDASQAGVDRETFEQAYRAFLDRLAHDLAERVQPHRNRLTDDVFTFWESVLTRCRATNPF